MSLHSIGIVYRKELTEALRDRRTLISTIIVPLLLFPVMIVGFASVASTLVGKAKEETPKVMILGGDDSPAVLGEVKKIEKIDIVPPTSDWKDQIVNKEVRAVVDIPHGFDSAIAQQQQETVKIYTYEGELKSGIAAGRIEKHLDEYRDTVVKDRLAAKNLPAAVLKPFEVKQQNVAPPEKVGGAAIGGLIGYMVILLCFTGAMYPAMDLTAGEKERGTMETILCSPVSRTDLVLGKFFMVLSASLATALLSVTSMTISFFWAKHGMSRMVGPGETGPFNVSLDPRGVFAVIVMVLPLSVLFSAGMLAIALFAKSFREAQSYLSPLTFIVIMPAVASFLPGVELNMKTALIPILSTSLVSKEIVAGAHPWGYIALIFATSCVYGGIALAIAVRMFNREDVLFRI